MNKSMLIISQRAPWSGLDAREALDIALAGGAFDLPISMLFIGDGVLQLLNGQQPQQLELKNLQANLKALPMFGVESLYVCADSLRQRSLSSSDLAMAVNALEKDDLRKLLADHDQVVNL